MRPLLLTAFLLAAVSACSNDAGTNPFLLTDGGTTPGPDAGNNAGSNSGACLGCLANGVCLNGDEAANCGSGGAACLSCAADQVCTEDGQCVVAPTCDRDSCDGCCDANGDCQAGNEVTACGIAGLACSACPPTGNCQNGTCRQPCNADTCSGCCAADGTCVAGAADDSCGVRGAACADCTTTAAECSAGQCVSTACADSCAGCCDGDSCVEPTSASQCGASGAACVDCGAGRTCGASGCEVADDSLWNVFVGTGEVGATDSAGQSWDGFNGLPDPFVDLSAADPLGGDFTGISAVVDDTLTPAWNETLLTQVPARALRAGITILYRDSDAAFDDEICDIAVSPSDVELAFAGGIVESACPDANIGKVRWRLEPSS